MTDTPIVLPDPLAPIVSMVIFRDRLYIATSAGAYRLSEDNKVWEPLLFEEVPQ